MIWYRRQFEGHPEQLASLTECAKAAGVNHSAIRNWQQRYADFPEVVCAESDLPRAKKYLAREEFATWLLKHHQRMLADSEQVLRRRRRLVAQVEDQIWQQQEQLRITEQLHTAWTSDSEEC